MILLTVFDDSSVEKYLEIKDAQQATNIQFALIDNGCMVKREVVHNAT
jgi:hypothetical protein